MAETINFSTSIYRNDAVEAAAQAYGHLAKIRVEANEGNVVLHIEDIDERVSDRLVDALCNHALYETVARTRAEDRT